MNYRSITYILGWIMRVEGVFLLLPMIVALIYGEDIWTIYLVCAFLTLAIGVLLLSSIRGFIESPMLQPAFDNILPALFGPLAVVYVAKNWKVAMTPLVFMIVLFICVPSLASSASVLVPVGALLAIGAARILYKKGLI